MTTTVAVDAMGGDFGPSVTIPACISSLERYPDLHLVVVGRSRDIEDQLGADKSRFGDRLRIQQASEIVAMDEAPGLALRNKKDSSMRVAINAVKSGEAQACVSAGNTGALMASARFVLKTLPGIDRPAIVGRIPSLRGHVHMLDLGANVDSPAYLLMQFAVMGSILVKYLENKPRPSIGLLNIGVEDIKGNEIVKEANRLMRDSNLNFKGYVEGDAIYTGDVDVIVCDGFDGNVSLKTSEGMAQFIARQVREEFNSNILTRIAGLMAIPVINRFRKRIDHRRYNGAAFVGLNGIVIKSHGGADVLAFSQAIIEAIQQVQHQVPENIRAELALLMQKAPA
ncbi:MAG: phosphate acyltransferase PlsX [Arenicellales bacterium]